ncbi:MAG TPA: hypothetical protein VKU60_12895, partial [Chloroflexota bacterium]|nr:hypothetical protein [Chloroflexota bacterium]
SWCAYTYAIKSEQLFWMVAKHLRGSRVHVQEHAVTVEHKDGVRTGVYNGGLNGCQSCGVTIG